MPEKTKDTTKDNEILIKINDKLVALENYTDPNQDQQKDSDLLSPIEEPTIPLKSELLDFLPFKNEFKVLIFDLSKEEDRQKLEQVLEEVSAGWWPNVIYYDCKYNSTENKWQVLFIISREYVKISNKQ
jgi:hypothetical protein